MSYVDTRLDCWLPRPSDTALFSPEHYGNIDGAVTSGMAANWTSADEDCDLFNNNVLTRAMRRDTCDHSSTDAWLYTDAKVRIVRQYQSYDELCQPYHSSEFEFFHNLPHVWIGGHMSRLPCSPLDPMFWAHHAQVDKLGHEVQERVPASSWTYPTSPDIRSGHRADDPMSPFDWFSNADGLNNELIGKMYVYERSPADMSCRAHWQCSIIGLLWCDRRAGRGEGQCKAKSREGGVCEEGVHAMCYCKAGKPRCDVTGTCQCVPYKHYYQYYYNYYRR